MWNDKVIWSEGLFLQPQHLQQLDRRIDRLVEDRARVIAGQRHGFATLALDEQACATGRVEVQSASGVLPDGTVFDAPGTDPLPAAYVVPSDLKSERIFLVVAARRQGQPEADLAAGEPSALDRYGITEFNAADAFTPERSAPIQVGRLNLRLLRERELTGAYSAVGVCRVIERRPDNQVVLDREYIPPALSVRDSGPLAAYARELLGVLHQRGEAIARDLAQPGPGGIAEIADFLLLQTINRFEPLFAHLADLAMLHPERLYSACLMLAGDLSAVSRESRRPIAYPPYQQDDLEATFRPLVEDLRRLLLALRERRAVSIGLEDRKNGFRLALIHDKTLLRNAAFVLAVNAQIPANQLQTRVVGQVKFGPPDKLRNIVFGNLPGVPLRALPVAPRHLPFHAGFSYFEIDRGDELWRQIDRLGALALHVPDDSFPGLELELWAVKEQAS